MRSTGEKTGWLIAEPFVLLTGLFTVLVYMSLPYSPIATLTYLMLLPPIIPAVAGTSLVIWKYRKVVSNTALAGSVAISCYSWLQFVLPIGIGLTFMRILVLLLLLTPGVYLIMLSAEKQLQRDKLGQGKNGSQGSKGS